MVLETVKDKKQAYIRIVSVLLYKLATAESKDVAKISKELRLWYGKWVSR